MNADNSRHPVSLVILCKRPKLHQGKQRLAATLGAEQALALAEAFLLCTLEDARDWPGPVVLSPASDDDRSWAEQLLPGAEVYPQLSGNLGERLMVVDQGLRRAGHRTLLFIGTDAPALEQRHYRAALQAFDQYGVVLSAASDGGVTMMGSDAGWPDLSALPWSTGQLGAALKNQCLAAGMKVGFIQPSYDIDLEQDLRRLVDDLQRDRRPARQQLLRMLLSPAVNTRRLQRRR